jgi:transcriptional regulator with XRE-family HTH domain
MSTTRKTKFITADEFLGSFPAEDRAKIDARARELIAQELTLRDLRKALDLTQKQISATLGVGQEHISRLEQRSDMLLTTLASYVEAMGGSLKLMVVFPDRAPVALTGLADVLAPAADEPHPRSRRRRRETPRGTSGAAS